ncbi:MAG: hypothetical protein V5789_00935 [Colwellia sp.]
MWRKLTVMLFLFVLAQTANALPISEMLHDESSKPISTYQIEQPKTSVFDHDESEDSFNLPRFNRFSLSLFSTEIQTTPNYVLVIEFFKIKLTAGLFKHLANPPLVISWFEKLSHRTNSSRLSGWKDGNFLYSSRTTYHS